MRQLILAFLLIGNVFASTEFGNLTERQKLLLKIPEGHAIELGHMKWEVILTDNGPREIITYFWQDAVDLIETIRPNVTKFTRFIILPQSRGRPPAIVPSVAGSLENGILKAEQVAFHDLYNLSAEELGEIAQSMQNEAREVLEALGIDTDKGLAAYIERNFGAKKTAI